MKIRIRGNSIRLRLHRGEVKKIIDEGRLTEKTSFGPNVFSYSFVSDAAIEKIQARFDQDGIHILVPSSQVQSWASSNELGLYGEQNTNDGLLKILIEKDLMCIKPRNSPLWEDESDAYPNPNTSCGGTHV